MKIQPDENTSHQVTVAMIGARRHYAVPLTLNRLGMLEHFYTDAYAGKGWMNILSLIPRCCRSSSLARLLARCCEVPPERITSFNAFGFEYLRRLKKAKCRSESTAAYLWAGDKFNELILRSVREEISHLYAFQGAALGLFRSSQLKGTKCILDMFSAPPQNFNAILYEENDLWPGWESWEQTQEAEDFSGKVALECKLAHVIVAPSQFVIDGLVGMGIQRTKCRLVPYGIDVTRFSPNQINQSQNRRLRVLFVGRVSIMKGIQYLLRAAMILKERVNVRIVGRVACNYDKLAAMTPGNVEFVGHVPRSVIQQHYHWADVFCLPSLSEGSAGVTYEALASGLPVICTPNTGSVVRDNVDGFVVSIRDSQVIVDRLEHLASNRKVLTEMSHNARLRAENYSWTRYGDCLAGAVSTVASMT